MPTKYAGNAVNQSPQERQKEKVSVCQETQYFENTIIQHPSFKSQMEFFHFPSGFCGFHMDYVYAI